MELGFENWSRRDYQQFIKGVEKVGRYVISVKREVLWLIASRDDIEGIASEITDKTVEETEQYAKVFWKRWMELDGEYSKLEGIARSN
jgi:SWI/SNF-related matrix-associated actin-dependent regulator of chromatin subfamily A member 5